MRAPIIPVAAKNKFLSIGTEHRKGVETLIPADLFDILAIEIAEIHVEWKSSFVFVVAAKNDMLAIGSKVRRPVGLL